jgi:DNA-binding NarL/FixJ family response regulator
MATRTVTKDYGGVVEPSAVRLALARIRRFGFPRHEWPDLLQKLALEISGFAFDPAKANGATELTAICCLVDRRLISALRAKRRYQKRIGKVRPEDAYEEQPGLRLDVREALAGLSPREQAVCEGLSRGDTISEIAKALECGRATIRRLIEKIRQRFTALGLDGWVRP